MNHTVWEYIQKTQMISRNDTVIAGVSGGADSVCLLRLLAEYRSRLDFSLRVVHVEHGIRGEESRKDALFVEQLCKSLRVPCTVYSVNVPKYAAGNRMGTEEAARRLRYQAFGEEAAGWPGAGTKVALAHHREDDAETILFQLIRGSGITGLCGMRPVRQMDEGYTCIRPLLSVSRKDIEAYLRGCGQEFREDMTNWDVGYSRNKIRQQVFPLLEQINSQAVPHIRQSALQLAGIRDYMEQQAKMAEEGNVTLEDGTLYLEIGPLLALHPALQEHIVRNALFRAGQGGKDIAAVHIAAVTDLMQRQTGRQLALPCGITARREYGRLALCPKREASRDECGEGMEELYRIGMDKWREWKADGKIHCVSLSRSEKFTVKIFPFSGDVGKIPKKACTKWLDYDMIREDIEIRHRMPEDMLCIDAQGHHKKLKRYLMDKKIPAGERDRLWILAEGIRVAWILGDRIGEDYKVSGDTSYIAEVTYAREMPTE